MSSLWIVYKMWYGGYYKGKPMAMEGRHLLRKAEESWNGLQVARRCIERRYSRCRRLQCLSRCLAGCELRLWRVPTGSGHPSSATEPVFMRQHIEETNTRDTVQAIAITKSSRRGYAL